MGFVRVAAGTAKIETQRFLANTMGQGLRFTNT